MTEADLLIVVGSRMGEMTTGGYKLLKLPKPEQTLVHVYMDPGELGRVYRPDLPICKPNQQDGCINGWEKNRTGNRPLNYWPGKPASEIPGKKPMKTSASM